MLSTKGRRKIEVDGRPFVWHVADDFDSPYKVLQVASDDKHMILAVPLQTSEAYVISKGIIFRAILQAEAGNGMSCRSSFLMRSRRSLWLN